LNFISKKISSTAIMKEIIILIKDVSAFNSFGGSIPKGRVEDE